MFTYVLQLEDDCWYVGKSTDVKKRFSIHMLGGYIASPWTTLHKPIKIFKVYKGDHEREVTLAFMKIFGPTKVRGFGWSLRVLNAGVSEKLLNLIANAKVPDKLCDELGRPELKYKPIPYEVKYKLTLPF